jgi:hypothetical protein
VQPDAGGRFEALLIAQDESGARFRVELATSAGLWTSEAAVSAQAGEVQWRTWSGTPDTLGEPPEWLCRYLRATLRAAWRGRAEDGWPRRLTRWRDAPDERRARGGDENG